MSIPEDFDAGDRAKRAVLARQRQEDIAEQTALLLEHAAREGWGEVEGLPTLSGDCLIYRFSTGKVGRVRLPFDTNFDYKG